MFLLRCQSSQKKLIALSTISIDLTHMYVLQLFIVLDKKYIFYQELLFFKNYLDDGFKKIISFFLVIFSWICVFYYNVHWLPIWTKVHVFICGASCRCSCKAKTATDYTTQSSYGRHNAFSMSSAEFKKSYRLSKSLTRTLIEDLRERKRNSLNMTCKVWCTEYLPLFLLAWCTCGCNSPRARGR